MRKILKWALRLVLVLVVASAALAIWKREDIARLLAVNSLFSEEKIVQNFSGMGTMFHSRPIATSPAAPLPQGQPLALPAGYGAWAEARNLTALVVVKDGAVVAEDYRLGTTPDDLRVSWSMAKSVLSLLYGILLKEGAVPPLDALVTDTVPTLKGTAYEGVRIKDVFTMSSGIKFNEDYLDFNSDINVMGRVLALGGSMDGFAASQKTRENPPGSVWQYVSIDTHVLGMVIRAATGQSVIDLVGARLFTPMGLERAPYYVTDGHGVAFVLGGLNMTTRDYARIGLLVAQGGQWGGRQLVPQDWIAQSIRPQAPGGALYGYQWWVPEGAEPGEVIARGVYGQYIYIHQGKGVVVAMNAADRKFRQAGVNDGNVAMFRAIAAALE